jgi:hypothetical protein
MTGLGVPRADWEERPAMLPQINIAIPQVSLRDGFRAKLESLSVAGERVRYRAEEGGFFSVDFGHQNVDLPGGTVDLGGRRVPIAELGMSNVTIEDKCGANAYHIPEGILLIYDPADRSPKAHLGRTRLSTLDLAPALLENFGVPVPGYMRSPAAGSARLS